MNDVRVVIADDEAIVRRGVRLILDHAEGIEVVGEVENGRQAISLAAELKPDVVLMDLRMPEVDGIEATPAVIASGARVLILTTYDLDENLYNALRAGAGGFILKTAHPEDLAHGVRVVARGDALLEPAISRRLIERHLADGQRRGPPAWADLLTDREHDVLGLMMKGRSNAEIAGVLFLSEGTVKTHVAGIFAKLRVRDRLQAVVMAHESGYIAPGDGD